MAAPSCPGCQQRDNTIADLRLRLAVLEARVRELEAQVGRNATNSSLPPSANPPGAPKLPPKKPSGRTTGGQPGHPAHLRRRLPAERVQHVRDFVPRQCQRCQEPLPPLPAADDPEPTWHQVAESLWTFVRVEGVEPTNNYIERLLRLAVLWRKKSLGSQSEAGCRFVERLLTVVQTRRLQGRSVLDYLYEALVAHRAGRPAPKLI
jgi:hypothetical protein